MTMDEVTGQREQGSPPSPWRSSRFRLFFTARSTSLLADGMLMVSLTTAVLGAGYGAAGVGYALAAWMAPIVLLVLFGGVFADRFTPQVMMVGADVVRMVAMLALAVLLIATDIRLWQIMALLALSGAATAMFQPGLASLVPQVAEDIQRANALLRISEAICTLLGPGVAGLLVAYWNVAGSFVVIAAAYALSALGLAPLRRLGTARDESDDPLLHRLATGWHEFRSRSWLWGSSPCGRCTASSSSARLSRWARRCSRSSTGPADTAGSPRPTAPGRSSAASWACGCDRADRSSRVPARCSSSRSTPSRPPLVGPSR